MGSGISGNFGFKSEFWSYDGNWMQNLSQGVSKCGSGEL
jgi:hypothetical protein